MKKNDEFLLFCKNSKHLEVTRIRSIEDELENFKIAEELSWSLHDKDQPCLAWFIVSKCIEEFREENGYYAGSPYEQNLDFNSD